MNSTISEIYSGININLPFDETANLVSLLKGESETYTQKSIQRTESIDCGVIHTCNIRATITTLNTEDITHVKFRARMSIRIIIALILVFPGLFVAALGTIITFGWNLFITSLVVIALILLGWVWGVQKYAEYRSYQLLKAISGGHLISTKQKRNVSTRNQVVIEVDDMPANTVVEHFVDTLQAQTHNYKLHTTFVKRSDTIIFISKWRNPLLGTSKNTGIWRVES